MLELKNIVKDYITGDMTVHALKGATLSFRTSEFVSILGPSGCGKTTMLNIVGGLDRYTKGDLLIDGRSTKKFKAYDWDSYRNNHVGFVFQSYNLIPHQTVLGNVELALTLTGMSKTRRRAKAIAALEKVGLKDQIHKRPNQLSGGQMQRVAIARAIVNEPSIILADEPTGALDSVTSGQIMEILKEISGNRLIIMVTHNEEIAKKYSTRIVKLLDGEILSDSDPYIPGVQDRMAAMKKAGLNPGNFNFDELENEDILPDEKDKSLPPEFTAVLKKELADKKRADKVRARERVKKLDAKTRKLKKRAEKQREKDRKLAINKTAMSLGTAMSLSGRNLLTKKGRTFMISLAGSIGIIGIALVLAIQNGFTGYIAKMQADMLSSVPISINQQFMDIASLIESGGPTVDTPEFSDEDKVTVYTPKEILPYHFNRITEEYVDYVTKGFTYNASDMAYSKDISALKLIKPNGKTAETVKYIDAVKNFSIEPNLVRKTDKSFYKIDTSLTTDGRAAWQEMVKNTDFLQTQYDILNGHIPEFKDGADYQEVALIIDSSNRVTDRILSRLGIDFKNGNYKFADFVGLEYVLLANDNYYEKTTINGEQAYKVKDDSALIAAFNSASTAKGDIKLKISGILRVKQDAPMSIYNPGLIYPQNLTQEIIKVNAESQIVKEQKIENTKGFSGKVLFPSLTRKANKTIAESVASSLASSMASEEGGGMSAADLAQQLQILPINLLQLMETDKDAAINQMIVLAQDAAMQMAYAEAEATAEAKLLASNPGATAEEIAAAKLLARQQVDAMADAIKADAKKQVDDSIGEFADYASIILTYLYHEQASAINYVAGSSIPVSLTIYPLDFDSKENLTLYLNHYNEGKSDANVVKFSDTLAILGSTMNNLVNIISYVLIAFAAISLIVSSIMIAIITYVSVIERTKEIGVLRSIGARKKDITRVFNAETIIIGLIAGILGVTISFLLTIPINFILNALIASNAGGMMITSNLASLNPLHALALVGISVVLTLISGLIPALLAAKKDPVVALRTE